MHQEQLGAQLAGSRIRAMAEVVSKLQVSKADERTGRHVLTAFSSERLLALDAILDASSSSPSSSSSKYYCTRFCCCFASTNAQFIALLVQKHKY
jgi:hypothetical protein